MFTVWEWLVLGPYVGSGLFLVKIIEFQYIWGFSEKIIFFGDMKILWIFLGGHHKIIPVLRVISMYFRFF